MGHSAEAQTPTMLSLGAAYEIISSETRVITTRGEDYLLCRASCRFCRQASSE
jgi:translation initiation factor 2B subunit (eIF-2B alpha/beta/delta family)